MPLPDPVTAGKPLMCLMSRSHEYSSRAAIGPLSCHSGLFTEPGGPCCLAARQCSYPRRSLLVRTTEASPSRGNRIHAPGCASCTQRPRCVRPRPSLLPAFIVDWPVTTNSLMLDCPQHHKPFVDIYGCFRFNFDGEDRLLIHSFLVQFSSGEDRRIIDQQGFHFFLTSIQMLGMQFD